MEQATKATDVQKLFDHIALHYDFVNHIISLGFVSWWYHILVHTILKHQTPHYFLDLCCGTGAISQRLVQEMRKRKLPIPNIDCVDFSTEMLHIAKNRLDRYNVSSRCINADATLLPLNGQSYDSVTIAFGIRNITEKKKAIEEVSRVLERNGMLYILELISPSLPLIRMLHSIYMDIVVPVIGGLCTFHQKPYRYLHRSITTFSLPDLINILHECGFQCKPPVVLGFGCATCIEAEKL